MGVLSSMAPNRSADIASLAFSALVTGFFSTIQTAAIACAPSLLPRIASLKRLRSGMLV